MTDEALEGGRVRAILVGVTLGATMGASRESRGFGTVLGLMCFKRIALEAHQ